MPSIQQLITSTSKFKSKLLDNAFNVKVISVNVTRMEGTRTILFSGVTKDSESLAGRTVQLQFIVPKGEDVQTYVPSISKGS